MTINANTQRITEDDTLTPEEEAEEQRFAALPEEWQHLALLAALDQFEATPSYFESNLGRQG